MSLKERIWLIALIVIVVAAYIPAVHYWFQQRLFFGIPGLVVMLCIITSLVFLLLLYAARRGRKWSSPRTKDSG